MPRLYGDRVSDAESALLIEKLRVRGSSGSLIAANTVGKGPSRDATAETSNQAREAILLELREWADLDKTAPIWPSSAITSPLRSRASASSDGRTVGARRRTSPLPLAGGCLCGGVRFEVTEPPLSASYPSARSKEA